jgi:photosystem II stability/assembly factor-like uncharacterized protein
MVIDPQNSGTLYAAANCGIYKTTDGAASWNAINSGLNPSKNCIGSLAIDFRNPGTLFAGGSGGMFKTADGGASWIPVGSEFQSGDVAPVLAIDPHT